MKLINFLFGLVVISYESLQIVLASSKDKPHTHSGVLNAYDGKHIPYSLDAAQTKRLNAGEAVTWNDRTGKSGRGVCVQDIHAPPNVCMDRIRDIANYKNVVPKVKSVESYSEVKFENGTFQTGATFNVGLSLIGFTYYLLLTYEPKYNTYTWTLDYSKTSDFDDNTGHWQVLDHPTKPGWTRVLYSTEVKLYPWIPEFVVTFLTKTALIESTTWVRRESEKVARKLEAAGEVLYNAERTNQLKPCFVDIPETGGSKYETYCADKGFLSTDSSSSGSSGSSESTSDGEIPKEEL